MATKTSLAADARSELAALDGLIIGPEDAGYDTARRVNNGMIDRRPARDRALRVGPPTSRRIVSFARDRELPSRCAAAGTAQPASASATRGSSPTSAACVDRPRRGGGHRPGRRRLHLGRGRRRHPHRRDGDARAACSHRPASAGSRSAAATATSRRRHGLTIDNLVAARRWCWPTARWCGRARRQHPDLFWALRGGGGNFGVVTAFTFRTHPVATVLAGFTFWPLERLDEVLRAYREVLRRRRPATPTPTSPRRRCRPRRRSRPSCTAARSARCSGATSATRPPPPPTSRRCSRLAAACCTCCSRCRCRPCTRCSSRCTRPACRCTGAARSCTTSATARSSSTGSGASGCRRRSRRCTSTRSTAPPTTSAAADTAFAHRDATWSQIIAGYDPDPASAERLRAWVVGYAEAVAPHTAGAGYVNFLMDEGGDRVRATYGPNYDRLARVKARLRPGEPVPHQPEHRAGAARLKALRRRRVGRPLNRLRAPPVPSLTRARRRRWRSI